YFLGLINHRTKYNAFRCQRRLMKSKLTSDGRKNSSELSGLKMRRSSNIMMYLRRENLIAENYMRRQTFRIDMNAMMLLSYFSNWRTASEASESLRGYTRESVFHTIQNLRDTRLLITTDSIENNLEHKFVKKCQWPT